MGAIGQILLNLFIAVIPGIAKAILERLLNKPKPPEQTAAEAVLEVANKEAEVQHEVNTINSKPMAVDDALNRLRKRATDAYPPDGRGT